MQAGDGLNFTAMIRTDQSIYCSHCHLMPLVQRGVATSRLPVVTRLANPSL